MAAHLSVGFAWMTPFTSWVVIDQFFVLSGFLITTLLLREYGTSNRIGLRSFYVRRIGRLYPMILTVLAISVILRLFFAPTGLAPTWLGISSIAAYFANWVVIAHDSYRDLAGFSPTWSLAIEEQFYLIWPTFLIAFLAISRRRICLIIAVATATLAMILYRRSIWLGYLDYAAANPGDPGLIQRGNSTWLHLLNGTFTRPDGILIGVLGALILGFRPTLPTRRVRIVLAAFGNAAFIVSILIFINNPVDERPRFIFDWGLAVFNVCTMVLVYHLLYNPRSLLSRLYQFRPLVWLGRRSYAIYIIHLFVYQVAAHNGWDSLPLVTIQTATIFLIAGLSYRYYEAPIRVWAIRRFARAG